MSDRRRHLQAVPDPGSPEADVEALAEPLGEWLAEQHPDLTVEIVHEPLVFAVTVLRELGDTDITRFSPENLERLLDICQEELPHEQFALLNLVLAVALAFFTETGRWTGTEEEAEECAALVDAGLGTGLEGALELVAEDRPPLAEEDAALARLPLVREAEALLRWIGPSRKVTSTGRITRKDLAGAAAALGIDLPTAPQAPQADGQESIDLGTVPDPLPPRNLNAKDLPELETMWGRLEAAELVERKGSTMRPTPHAAALLGDDLDARVEARRDLVLEEVAGLVFQCKAPGVLPVMGEIVVALLAGACTGSPADADGLDDLLASGLEAAFSGSSVTLGPDDDVDGDDPDVDDPDDDPDDEDDDVLANLLAAVVRSQMGSLADLGLIDLSGGSYAVPDALRPVVAQGLIDGLGLVADLGARGFFDDEDSFDE